LVDLFLWLDADLPSQVAFYLTTKRLQTLCKNSELTKRSLSFISTKKHPYSWKLFITNKCALFNYTKLLAYYKEMGCDWDEHQLCYYAAYGGHLPLLKTLLLTIVLCDVTTICSGASRGNHVNILEWLSEKKLLPLRLDALAKLGAQLGHLSILQFAKKHDQKLIFTPKHSYHVAGSGNFNTLRVLREEMDCPWDSNVFIGAIHSNSLSIINYAIEKKCPWSVYVAYSAACYGSVMCFEALMQADCPYNMQTIYSTAHMGRKEILKWWHLHEYPWDEKICASVACCDDRQKASALLRWLRKKGCPWDARTCANLASVGDIETFQWALQEGCPCDEETCAKAAEHGHLAFLKAARDAGCPWDTSTVDNAFVAGGEEIFEWCLKNGAPQNFFCYS
jgi:hypothetical protein